MKEDEQIEYQWYCTKHKEAGIKGESYCGGCHEEFVENFPHQPWIKLMEIIEEK